MNDLNNGSFVFPVVIQATHRGTYFPMFVGQEPCENYNTDKVALFKNRDNQFVLRIVSKEDLADVIDCLEISHGETYSFEARSVAAR